MVGFEVDGSSRVRVLPLGPPPSDRLLVSDIVSVPKCSLRMDRLAASTKVWSGRYDQLLCDVLQSLDPAN